MLINHIPTIPAPESRKPFYKLHFNLTQSPCGQFDTQGDWGGGGGARGDEACCLEGIVNWDVHAACCFYVLAVSLLRAPSEPWVLWNHKNLQPRKARRKMQWGLAKPSGLFP